ncbi:MAG: hypothetical protein WC841_01325 [Candidatus Shapirobacteria bacterium]|jgi:hypothetical protein
MDRDKIELFNVCSDLRRAIIDLTSNPTQSPENNHFIQNITNNFPRLIKIDPNISHYIKPSQLKNDHLPNRLFAENLLMASLRLQRYLGY